MEHNQTASDGTSYDNGYGICMIPRTHVTTGKWNTASTTRIAYKSSYMHTTVLPDIVTKLKTILGSHIVNRNVLLSSGLDLNNAYRSNAYTWTTAYATLMSIGQMTGTFAANTNKYDDGEANYKLPIFNSIEYKTGYYFWTRCIWGGAWGGSEYYFYAWYVGSDGNISNGTPDNTFYIRPLIYLR